MTVPRWRPRERFSAQERRILARTRKKRRLFAFLREHRMELFDASFQAELEEMYRRTGAGKVPNAPAQMAMALLLQGYLGISDADAVECSACDVRWQMVLGCLGSESAPFSQGALVAFRERLIASNMDQRLLERTVELARKSKAFDFRKLPKKLRVAVDSSPLAGAARVEDTFNLLAHAGRKLIRSAALLTGRSPDEMRVEMDIELLGSSSIKSMLDIDWDDRDARVGGLNELLDELAHVERWISEHLSDEADQAPLCEQLQTLARLREQDTEPDPPSGRRRIREGVAKDRQISVEDPEMRHGRKSSTKQINGYKRHVATDLDTTLIVSAALTPANRPDGEATSLLLSGLEHLHLDLGELHCDRGYVSDPSVAAFIKSGGEVLCKPWRPTNRGLFAKHDFNFHMGHRRVTCPGGQTQHFKLGTVLRFDEQICRSCELRPRCTHSKVRGRSLRIAQDEPHQHKMRKLKASANGRERLRQRVTVEHSLAHISQRQGNRARYRGLRNNLYDLRRAASIQNLETIQRVAA